MYIVKWDDREGCRQEMAFDKLEDAALEAEFLKAEFDFVEVSEVLD